MKSRLIFLPIATASSLSAYCHSGHIRRMCRTVYVPCPHSHCLVSSYCRWTRSDPRKLWLVLHWIRIAALSTFRLLYSHSLCYSGSAPSSLRVYLPHGLDFAAASFRSRCSLCLTSISMVSLARRLSRLSIVGRRPGIVSFG